ncbi:MAG: cell envelope integrity protein TolA [Deltaproteobacteria bacterium]|nr:cell envelope integrity protein TolA [Deltaproteobacteria bacterium]
MVESQRSDYVFGLTASAAGHLLLAIVLLFELGSASRAMPPPTIYSVTLEGGQSIGGIGQVPKDDKKQTMAPPKKVQAPAPAKEEKKEEKKEEVKTKPETKKPEEKAEVSLKEKEKEKEKKEPVKKPEKVAKKEVKETSADIDKRLASAMQRYLGESTDAGGKGFGAARLGGKGMGGGTLLPAEALMYRDLLKNRIKQGWRWYDTMAALQSGVVFEISSSGEISNVEIVSSSGNREFDDSVLRAVYKASPVPAPPEKVYEYFKKVRMVFDPRE